MIVFTFDIETIPDITAGRELYSLHDLNDQDSAKAMLQLRRQETQGSDFLPHCLHQIVAISVVLQQHDKIKVWSLGDELSDEKELIERFYAGIEKFTPTLVSWNGSGFDLPVIHYRSLIHGISAPRYWEIGDDDQQFRWNNYLNRYHYRHLDLMDVLAGYQARSCTKLDTMATLLGLPGKMGISGGDVLNYYQNNQLKTIREYCETDVLNTYLIFLRFQLLRGKLNQDQYQQQCSNLRQQLDSSDQKHFHAFLKHWKSCPK